MRTVKHLLLVAICWSFVGSSMASAWMMPAMSLATGPTATMSMSMTEADTPCPHAAAMAANSQAPDSNTNPGNAAGACCLGAVVAHAPLQLQLPVVHETWSPAAAKPLRPAAAPNLMRPPIA